MLLCGADRVLWEDPVAVLCFLECINYATAHFPNHRRVLTVLFRPIRPRRIRPPAAMLLYARFINSGRIGVPLRKLFFAACNDQDLHCVVPHDRVYALLGLMDGGPNFKVDYKFPYDELCMQTTVRILKQYPRILRAPETSWPHKHVNLGYRLVRHGGQSTGFA